MRAEGGVIKMTVEEKKPIKIVETVLRRGDI